ncbi:MAG: hypothetical protein V8S98_02430 [Lachnospiraceae bacterium]
MYLLFFVYGFWYFMIRDHRMAFVLVSMYSAVGIMFLMPEAPMRIYIPFLFLLTMVCGYLYVQVAGKMERLLVFSALVLFSLNAVENAKMIYQGYCENAKILTINHSKLLEAADQIAAGVEVKAVDLYRSKIASTADSSHILMDCPICFSGMTIITTCHTKPSIIMANIQQERERLKLKL